MRPIVECGSRSQATRLRGFVGSRTGLMVLTVCVLATISCGLAGAETTRPRNDFTFVLRERAGPYQYWRTLAEGMGYQKAVASFGAPTAAAKEVANSNLCTVRWERLGLDVGFAGVRTTCAGTGLRRAAWYGMRLWGPRWKTARGLQVGHHVGKIEQIYPRAKYVSRPPQPGEWWLIMENQAEFGRKPLLVAEVGAGRVIAIRVPAGYVF